MLDFNLLEFVPASQGWAPWTSILVSIYLWPTFLFETYPAEGAVRVLPWLPCCLGKICDSVAQNSNRVAAETSAKCFV